MHENAHWRLLHKCSPNSSNLQLKFELLLKIWEVLINSLSSASTVISKEELNFVLTVLTMLVKVPWVKLGGTDLLLPILRLATWFWQRPKVVCACFYFTKPPYKTALISILKYKGQPDHKDPALSEIWPDTRIRCQDSQADEGLGQHYQGAE